MISGVGRSSGIMESDSSVPQIRKVVRVRHLKSRLDHADSKRRRTCLHFSWLSCEGKRENHLGNREDWRDASSGPQIFSESKNP